MKVLILFFSLTLLSGYSIGQSLAIRIEIDTCIDARYSNNVKFIIENRDSSDYWIKTDFLVMYLGVYSSEGENIHRKSTRESIPIGGNEYTKIASNSQEVVLWNANFFDNMKFELGGEYYIKTGYEYLRSDRAERKRSRKSDFVLINSRINAQSNKFRICAL